MKISAHKCTAVGIRTTKDSWYLQDPNLKTEDGVKLPMATADTTIRYLGGSFSLWKGLTTEGLELEFGEILSRVQRLALKPHQKAHFINIPDVGSCYDRVQVRYAILTLTLFQRLHNVKIHYYYYYHLAVAPKEY
jgi:hypothetical protein